MKKIILMAICAIAATSAMARTIVLRNDARVFEVTNRGHAEELVTLRAGTEIELFRGERRKVAGVGSAVLVRFVLDADYINSDYRRRMAYRINDNSDYIDYVISEADLEGRTSRPRRDRVNPRRDRINPRPSFNEYQVCYETPRSRVVTINEQQRERGGRNIGGGIAGVIAGQIIGGITDNRRLGNAISAIGAGFAAVGAVQVASSKEVFYSDYDVDCRSYYTRDTRIHNFQRRGQYCTTTRYYTDRWNGTTEYFETECFSSRGRRGSSTRFVSFERNREFWYY